MICVLHVIFFFRSLYDATVYTNQRSSSRYQFPVKISTLLMQYISKGFSLYFNQNISQFRHGKHNEDISTNKINTNYKATFSFSSFFLKSPFFFSSLHQHFTLYLNISWCYTIYIPMLDVNSILHKRRYHLQNHEDHYLMLWTWSIKLQGLPVLHLLLQDSKIRKSGPVHYFLLHPLYLWRAKIWKR